MLHPSHLLVDLVGQRLALLAMDSISIVKYLLATRM